MAATQIAKPFHRQGWVYEEKVDGWRVLAYKDAAGVRLVSRNEKDLTRRFPELAAAVAALNPPTLVLDGEIAVFDRQLVSHFEWIRAQPKGEPATPPTLIAFYCLYTRGKDLRKRPLRVRRNALEDLVDGHALVLPARRLAAGLEAWAQVLERGYEGLVGKDKAPPHVEGRTLSWLKLRCRSTARKNGGSINPDGTIRWLVTCSCGRERECSSE